MLSSITGTPVVDVQECYYSVFTEIGHPDNELFCTGHFMGWICKQDI